MTVRVLMVDDDPGDAFLVSELLRDVVDVRHEVIHLTSLAATAAALADGLEVDVVLLDLTMPGTSGADTVHTAIAMLGDVPIVVHSGHSERDVAVEAVAAGAEDYLVKGQTDGDDIARVLANARERHRSRQALADALGQVERANDELRRMQRAQDEFVAIASHELRTPVTVASGFVRLLADRHAEMAGDQREDLLVRARAAMDRLQALTDDLLAVSRAGHGRVDPRTAAVSLADAVAEGIATSSVERDDVRADVDPDLVVVADQLQLTRVVRNLIDNAVRHGQPPIVISSSSVRQTVQLTVADHGNGVPDEFVPVMFDRFTQADASTSRSADGTGLGLAIVQGLVEAVGGGITYARAPHGGAAFTATLLPAEAPVGSTDGIGGVLGGSVPTTARADVGHP